MRWRGVRLPRDAASWRRFLFQACLNSVVPFTLIAWAEQSLDAGLATILNSTSPIFTFLLTAAITRHETVTAQKLFGVLAGIVGICLIVGVQALGRPRHGTRRADRDRRGDHLLRWRSDLRPRFSGTGSDGAGGRFADLRHRDPHAC